MVTRVQFFDGDDTKKWAGEAARQLELCPPGQEDIFPRPNHPFIYWSRRYNVPETGMVVDFGCGTGLMRTMFTGMSYIGIDQNPEMVAGIKTRWQERDSQVQVYETPLNQIVIQYPELREVADLGCFVTVLQHNHWETAGEILDQAAQVLKPDGILLLVEGTYIEKHYPLETRRKYNLPELDPERLESADAAAIFTLKGWINFLNLHGFDHLDYDGDCTHVARRKNALPL
jgi:SAM-dependent methyltransferase